MRGKALLGLVATASIAAAIAGSACSSETTTASGSDSGTDGPATNDSGGGTDTGSTTAEDGGSIERCADDLVNDAPEVIPTLSNEPKPVPQGGAIVPGRYHATAIVVHSTTSRLPEKLRLTYRFTADRVDVREYWVVENEDHTSSLSYSTKADGGFKQTNLCSDNSSYSYTANGEALTLICAGSICPLEWTLKKVPD